MFKKFILLFLSFFVFLENARAKPMWEISKEWVCNKEYSTNIIVDENSDIAKSEKKNKKILGESWSLNRINEHENWTNFYDFKDNKVKFMDGHTNIILDKIYLDGGGPNEWNNKNIIITKLDDEKLYNVMVVEEHKYEKEFWGTMSWGPRGVLNDGILYALAYKCNPIK